MSAPPATPLLLASTSPQRRAILEQLGIPFEAVAPEYEEHDPPDADPHALVRAHAREKARSVVRWANGRPVLGVDTTVWLDGRVYGKPADAEDAVEMLDALGGHTHHVISGLCLVTPGWEVVEAEETAVTFRPLTPADLAAYEVDARVGGAGGRLRHPGARRRARRTGRGRLPERGRPAGGAARPVARRALPGRLRLRLIRYRRAWRALGGATVPL